MSQLREAMRELFQSTSPSARSMLRHTLVIGVLAARTAASGDHGGHGHNGMSSGNNTMAMPSVLDSLPDGPVCINGDYPLFKTAALANAASAVGTSHLHTFGGYYLYMVDGDYPDKMMGGELVSGGHGGHSGHGGNDHSGHDHGRMLSSAHAMTCPWHAIDASGIMALPETSFCAMGMHPQYKNSCACAPPKPYLSLHHTLHASDINFPSLPTQTFRTPRRRPERAIRTPLAILPYTCRMASRWFITWMARARRARSMSRASSTSAT